MKFYYYSVKDQKGNEISMAEYEGKVVLIVNTATGCGFTPQYKQLEEIYEKYHDKGLEIIDIPCNQFGNQAPG
ncbi:MAG: redoxin domain-containing protein, partial [Oscillospiraceae bacterium]|nr:redoxin domain-containing protein [Oscillospiraceae bacterium]